MARKYEFPDVHQRLQAASVAVDQALPDVACDLARDVLELHPGQPQALHVLEQATREAPDKTRVVERSIGGSFFLQKMNVRSADDRLEVIAPLVRDRRVLHVGCTDHPIFDPRNNLHVQLSSVAAELHGLDVDAEGLRELARHVPGRYFESVDAVRRAGTSYDLLLVPETIEHVADACHFLRELDALSFERFMLTAPCVYGGFQHPIVSIRAGDEEVGPYAAIMRDGCVVEEVHPDHKYWFTPYTLANLVESSVAWQVEEAWLMCKWKQVGLVGRRSPQPA